MPETPSFQATAGEIAALLGASGLDARLIGSPDIAVRTVSPLDKAGPEALSFVRSARYLREWPNSKSGVTLVSAPLMESDNAAPLESATDRAVVVVPDADMALIALLSYVQGAMPSGDPAEGVHPSASIDETATIGERVQIGPFVAVCAGAHIGDDVVLRAHATVGVGARVGAKTSLRERVVLGDRCVIGERSTVHPGTVIGADGFGYRPPLEGVSPYPIKIPHIGNVVIGDDVEIGANTCIDRATYASTRIGDGTKIDNLCQIGHNCIIGRGVTICGCCAMGGSTTVEDGVLIAGDVSLADNVSIGQGATLAGGSKTMRSVPAGETWAGFPSQPGRAELREQVAVRWLAKELAAVKALARKERGDG